MKSYRSIAYFCSFAFSILLSMKAEATWKKHGPIVVTKKGTMNVFVQQMDSENLEIRLLDAKGNEVQVVNPEGHNAEFLNVGPGSYYIDVLTDGFDEMIIHSNFSKLNIAD